MTEAPRPMPHGLHAFSKDGDGVVLRRDRLRIAFGDMLEQSESDGGVTTGGGAQRHVGVEHKASLDNSVLASMTGSWTGRKAFASWLSRRPDRSARYVSAAFRVGADLRRKPFLRLRPAALPSPPMMSHSPSPFPGTGVGVIAFPPLSAITPLLVIVRHCRAHQRHHLAQDLGRRPVQRKVVQRIEAVKEGVDHMVRHLRVAHRVDDRRGHVGQRHHRDPRLCARFPVLRHAVGIAA